MPALLFYIDNTQEQTLGFSELTSYRLVKFSVFNDSDHVVSYLFVDFQVPGAGESGGQCARVYVCLWVDVGSPSDDDY